eukprot:gene5929-biopygen2868
MAAMVASGNPFLVSKLSWTPKHGKPHGRRITDCSSGGNGQSPLNSDSTKDTSDAVWGEIVHPGIERAARMILSFFEDARHDDPKVQWSDLRLWKMDLKGAYTLISFLPNDVPLVVTRLFEFELKRRLKSYSIMYVDDIVDVCLAKDAVAETETVPEFADGWMGPDSIAPGKTVISTRLVLIGFDFDLATLQLFVSNRCLMRTLYCYFDVDLSRSIRVLKRQQSASLASRYSVICQPILPFKRRFHVAYAGHAWCHTFDGHEQRAIFIGAQRLSHVRILSADLHVLGIELRLVLVRSWQVAHAPADDNWRVDMLSRNRSWGDVVGAERNSSAPDERCYGALDANKVLNPEEVIAL